jgi:hypothetical protein
MYSWVNLIHGAATPRCQQDNLGETCIWDAVRENLYKYMPIYLLLSLTGLFLLHHENGDFSILMKDISLTGLLFWSLDAIEKTMYQDSDCRSCSNIGKLLGLGDYDSA